MCVPFSLRLWFGLRPSPFFFDNLSIICMRGIRPNIPISATHTMPLALAENGIPHQSLDYIPPHPARGSSLHRYTILLLRQYSRLESMPPITREGFSARKWVHSTKMEAAGVLSWISKWREQEAKLISEIYATYMSCVPFSPPPFFFAKKQTFQHGFSYPYLTRIIITLVHNLYHLFFCARRMP